jgi:membrane protease YdiL (CAAX protease family)
MVLDVLSETVGSRRAPPLDALLYAVSVTPTIFTLADPVAGPNPLLFFAALGCGIFFSYLASITRRLPPAIIAHIAFTYFSATQFRAPGL